MTAASIDFTTASPRFSVNNDETLKEGLDFLDKHGYVVISDVMNEDQIKVCENLLWNFLEKASNEMIQRNDPETWSNSWPSFSTHGVINGFGIGQSDLLWNVRSHPSVRKVFNRLWNNDELLVSFDGCGVFRDWRYNSSWKTNGGWNHVDQDPLTKPNQCCVQGFISLTNQSEKTGGLIVYPNSHLYFADLAEISRKNGDFVKVPNTHPILSEGKVQGKLVHCQAGDLVLWDSRTIHCNSPATNPEERNINEPVDLLRAVVYVCMMPLSSLTNYTLEEFREKRRQLVENNVTLTHWSTDLAIAYGENKGLPKLSFDQFNDYQKALIFGYKYNDDN